MPKHRKPEKKPIDQYDHKEASRTNNPPVGLVTPETDRDAGKKTYAYDPHIDPQRSQIEQIIDDALAAETIEERNLVPRQIFFPMAGAKDGWARLAKNLKAGLDPELVEAYPGTVSLPFEASDNGRIAVKIVEVDE
jgi:adenine-specific DNA-methyltransferase